MRRSQEVALEIQNAVTRARSGNRVSTRDLLALHEEHTRLVEQTNRRINESIKLLHQGYRSEALGLAESAPPVLEEAASLDLQNPEEWADLCQQQSLPQPSQIDLARASELNAAYFAEQRLGPLLVRHRRLALTRAPLEHRIQVLRHLMEEDRQNPVWSQDLRLFEKNRLREIERDLPQIARTRHLPQVEKLRQELAGKWLESVPDPIRKQVEELYQSIRREQARNALADLQSHVVNAHAVKDAEALRTALAEWRSCAKTAQIGEPDDEVTQAQLWLAESDRQEQTDAQFRAALMELEAMLDRPGNSPQYKVDLERAWTSAAKFDKPISQVLLTRYNNRRDELALETRRKFVLLAVGTACLLIAVAGIVGYVMFSAQKNTQARGWISVINQAIAEDRLQDAATYIDRLEQEWPQGKNIPGLGEAVTRAQAAISQDKSRAERFELAMTSLEQAGVGAYDPQTLATAEKLIKHDADRVRFERFNLALRQAQQKDQQQRDTAFQGTLESIRARFIQTKDDGSIDPEERANRLESISSEIQTLAARPDVSGPVRASADLLLTNVATVLQSTRQQADQARRRRDTIAQFLLLLPTPEQYGQALARYATDNPADPLANEFQRASALTPVWKAQQRWAGAMPDMPRPSDLPAIEAARAKVQAAAKDENLEPFKTQAAQIDDYLARLTRFVADRPWDGKLKRALEVGFVTGVMMVQTKAVEGLPGVRYYILPGTVPREVTGENGKPVYEFPYVTTPNQAIGSEPMNKTARVPANIYQPPARSPQQVFGDMVRPLLSERAALPVWEAYHLKWLQALRDASQKNRMDPVLVVMLAQIIVPDAISFGLTQDTQPLAEWRRSLLELKADNSWLDPLSPTADQLRAQAAELIAPDRWPDIDTMAQNATRRAQAIVADAGGLKNRRPVGVLMPDDAGRPTLIGPGFRPDSPAYLLEAFVSSPQSVVSIIGLGTSTNGQPQVPEGRLLGLPAGTLIYGTPVATPSP